MSGATASKVSRGGSSLQQRHGNTRNPTPSAAKLAKMFMRCAASHPHHPSDTGFHAAPATNNRSFTVTLAGVPTEGFQMFVRALLSQLPTLPKHLSIQCPYGTTPNIALLAQFVASELRAVVPSESTTTMAAAARTTASPATTKASKRAKLSHNGQAASTPAPKGAHHHHPVFQNRPPTHSQAASVNAAVAPSRGDGVDSEHPDGHTELVYCVKRSSKLEGGTYLKKTDLSTHFLLNITEAAERLRVSPSTLKTVSREFGHKRWPGRKVRSLASKIERLERTIAGGDGAGLEPKLSQLQQELDQIVHGAPAQKTSMIQKAAKDNRGKGTQKLRDAPVPKLQKSQEVRTQDPNGSQNVDMIKY